MKPLAAALLAALLLVLGIAPADAAAKPKVRVTGWTLQTSDTALDGGLQLPAHASYTMGCDTILEIDVDVTARRVKRNAAFSWKASYNGATQYAYSQAWTTSGKVVTSFRVMKTPNQTGTLTFTMKAKHKVLARGSLRITVAGCHPS